MFDSSNAANFSKAPNSFEGSKCAECAERTERTERTKRTERAERAERTERTKRRLSDTQIGSEFLLSRRMMHFRFPISSRRHTRARNISLLSPVMLCVSVPFVVVETISSVFTLVHHIIRSSAHCRSGAARPGHKLPTRARNPQPTRCCAVRLAGRRAISAVMTPS